jgi:sigma-B regulation protein RsbU (phosphoserine phosphatase)
MALGVMPELPYTCAQLQLSAGDMLLSYTDGVTEAFNSDLTAYGEARLKTLAEQSQQASSQDMVERIFTDVSEFANGAPQSDDITVAALSWEPVHHA